MKIKKICKHKKLEVEFEKMWHLKTITVQLTVETPDIIKKGTDKHVNNITECPSRYEIENIAICITAHLLRRVSSI